jgi:flagellar hook protein FlgE
MGSFQQGLSGLNASAKSLQVIGNNIANSGTVGFKQSRAQFADVYANQVGIGTSVSTVNQKFTQGNVSSTSNSLDISIGGNGFFRMSDGESDAVSFTRNGQFQMDKDGFIVDAQNRNLTGYAADIDGVLQKGASVPLQINANDLRPNATTGVATKVNLDSREDALLTANFDPDDPETYHSTTAISVFDSLGNAHTLQNFYVKTADNVWDMYSTANGAFTTGHSAGTPTATLTYPPTGTGVEPTTAPAVITAGFAPGTGAAAVSVEFDLSESTQFGSSFSVNANSQDGFTSGQLASFNTGKDGQIIGRYTNGETKILGQVATATFTNMNGLTPLGGNAWSESSESGQPLVGEPGTGLLGALQSNSLEDSNIDLTEELVNMITAQRTYQANAQTIKTQDQILQTIVNLR